MLPLDKITWLHAEITNKCNAWCPACGRNKNGYGLRKSISLTSISPSEFNKVLEQLPNLKTVQLCGTYGDPIASEYITEIIELCVEKRFNIQIHTNGSLKTKEWWAALSKKFENIEHTVVFGIDGLAGVHELYRQGTNFNKVIENAKAFIDGGGSAEWQFLLFKHNQHQVKDCMRLSQSLGFKKFIPKKSIRVPNPARHFQTGEPYIIEDDGNFTEIFNKNTKELTVNDCMHLSIPSIYMNADGSFAPCCYLTDVQYGNNSIDVEIANGAATDRCRNKCGRSTVAHKN